MRAIPTLTILVVLAAGVLGGGCATSGPGRADDYHASTSSRWHRYLEDEYGDRGAPRRSAQSQVAWSPDQPNARSGAWVGELIEGLLMLGAALGPLWWVLAALA